MKKYKDILEKLPYSSPFLFVDEINSVSEDEIIGHYTFKENEFFYEGHFKEYPITPGVILTECLAQIGLVSLGIYLLKKDNSFTTYKIAMSSTEIDFLLPVFPGETVKVTGVKEYFRFQKLKCNVIMRNKNNEIVCKGIISGMILPILDEK